MPRPHKSVRGSVRISGGRWRGRRLQLDPGGEIRPTAERVRETLFNWLTPVIDGAQCLDLFAGSGALGIEAVSRGGARAVLVDNAAAVITRLRSAVAALDAADAIEIVRYDALEWLECVQPQKFDIVFIDPPFATTLAEDALARLQQQWLNLGAHVYLERACGARACLPPGWRCAKEGRTKHVHYALLTRKNSNRAVKQES